jgi:Ca2+-binding EF-hand superfamily protein
MKKIFAAFMILMFAASLASAADPKLPRMDQNKDGKISRQEYLNATVALFGSLDKNRDGVLTKEEMQANKKIDADQWIREADTNQNGKIHKSEHQRAAKKRFFSLDKDKSGYIDRNEWKSSRSELYSPFNSFTF